MHKSTIYIFIVVLLSFGNVCTKTDKKIVPEIPSHINELENVIIYDSTEKQTSTIQFISDQIFGNRDDVMVGTIGGVEVDEKGRVYVADTIQNTIHVFNTEGTYLANAGREGSGPGEFRNIAYTEIDSDWLYAYDWAQQAIHLFSLNSFEVASTITPAEESHRIQDFEGIQPGQFFVRQDGTFLMSFIQPRGTDKKERHQFYLVSSEGTIISEKVLEQTVVRFQYQLPVPGMIVVLPFYRKPLLSILNNDYILTAWSEEFLIKRYNPNGEYVGAVYYPFQNVDIHPDELKSRYENQQAKNAIDDAEFSETTWPALEEMLIDDENRLWISTIVDDFDIYEWWVLEESGELITRFEWPRDEPIKVVKNGYMYTRETDEETDLQQVVRYRIELEEV
jgi:hypothetical protein